MALLPLLWSLTLYSLRGWRSAPRRNRMMSGVWACWALCVTVGAPAVRRVIDALIGVNSVTNLLVHLLSLAGTAGIVEFVREMTGRSQGRVSRLNLVGLAVASTVLTTAFAVMPRPNGDIDLLTYSQSSLAGYTYWAVLSGDTALGLAAAARICWIHGKYATPGPARTSLWLMRAATLLGTVYLVHRFVYVTARYAHRAVPPPSITDGITEVLLALTLLLIALAVVSPALADYRQKKGAGRQADRIEPLWRLLQTATPGVALPLPEGLRRKNPRLRLYRYVIEIRDSALAVEHHLGAGHPASAEAALRAAGFDGAAVVPAVEAVLIRYAVAAQLEGREPVFGGRPEVRGALDLTAEIRWFEQVAAASELPAVVTAAGLMAAAPCAPVSGPPNDGGASA